jgi:phosphoribosylformylglycinamidine synthase
LLTIVEIIMSCAENTAAIGPRFEVHVEVFPRREILDPQGKAIADALGRLGFATVEAVHAGKSFTVELVAANAAAAEEMALEMCRKLLANPIVEDFRYQVSPRAPAGVTEGTP